VLVLEEAHRVLPEMQDTSGDPETGSARSASSALLTGMLAEVRSYGQQVIVVDQSPSKVAADVVRNTNLRIVHRTVAAEDQKTMAAAVGIPEADAQLFGSLGRGQAIISTRQETSPQTIAVALAQPVDRAASITKVARSKPTWPCCEAQSPERHYRAWQASAQAESAMSLFLIACRVGATDEAVGETARERVSNQLAPIERSVGASAGCLAWAGLRRILVAERNSGIVPSATAVNTLLEKLYSVWADDAPATPASSKSHAVPTTGKAAICPDCGIACYVRIPAGVLARSGPRTGLSALFDSGWRSELTGIGDWAKGEVDALETILGRDGAARTVRCQIHQAVNRSRLSAEVAGLVVKRAGISER
jgi:hypothetical protein